jgi:palmitoyl-protein thioesterase
MAAMAASAASAASADTVLIHGIASSKNELTSLAENLSQYGTIHNIEIGNGFFDSIFMNMNRQCELLATSIDNLDICTEKINLIGISQGGLLARCYTERYSHTIKPVHSLITIAAPHMGLYDPSYSLIKLEYWKNPYLYNEYIADNDFLVYMNNAKDHEMATLYKRNLAAVDNFVMIWSAIDEVIAPMASARFEYYDILRAERDDELVIDPLTESDIFRNDSIGLRQLYDTDRLHRIQVDCQHVKFKQRECYSGYINILINYL